MARVRNSKGWIGSGKIGWMPLVLAAAAAALVAEWWSLDTATEREVLVDREKPGRGQGFELAARELVQSRTVDSDPSCRLPTEANFALAGPATRQSLTEYLAKHGIEALRGELTADAVAVVHAERHRNVDAIRERAKTIAPDRLERGRHLLQAAELREQERMSAFEDGAYVLLVPEEAGRVVDVLSKGLSNASVWSCSGLSTTDGVEAVAVVVNRPAVDPRRGSGAARRLRQASSK